MPSKNHNPRANTAPRALQAVPTTPASAGRTAAEEKLWATLNAHPATTTASLAVLAGIGRSKVEAGVVGIIVMTMVSRPLMAPGGMSGR